MNVAIQCLVNTKFFKEYILEDEYLKHINTDNKLGKKGEVICATAELVKIR